MPDPGPKIFISYSRNDRVAVQQLASLLSGAGFQVWIDYLELAPGEDWAESLNRAVHDASSIIVCIGQAGVSRMQQGEYQTALRAEAASSAKLLIPVLLPGADTLALPTDLRERVWVDLRTGIDNSRELSRLIAALQTTDTGKSFTREE